MDSYDFSFLDESSDLDRDFPDISNGQTQPSSPPFETHFQSSASPIGPQSQPSTSQITPKSQDQTSFVWSHFEEVEQDIPTGSSSIGPPTKRKRQNSNSYRCLEPGCGKVLRISEKSNASTSNLKRHLNRIHHIDANSLKAAGQDGPIDAWINGDEGMVPKSPSEKLEESIVEWIVVDNLPFTTVESAAFQAMVGRVENSKYYARPSPHFSSRCWNYRALRQI